MVHTTKKINPNVLMMWCEPNIKTEQEIKFVAKKDIVINIGDAIDVGPDEHPYFYVLGEIKERRESTVSGWDYLTATATRQKGEKQEA